MADINVVNYTFSILQRLLRENYQNYPQSSQGILPNSQYFEKYFNDLGVKTLVVEMEYIDRDYLEDFSAYYVRCFEQYKNKCIRLHFFKEEFSQQKFTQILSGFSSELEKVQNSYLGFMVLKPLPKTYIGRTCLKINDSEERREFPVAQVYEANLFGISLSVKSLAFQEQDQVLSACATSALWSAFHITGKVFHHAIPSPVEITKHALTNAHIDGQLFPSRGLTSYEIATAIRSVGLESTYIPLGGFKRGYEPKALIYAYLKGKLPVILGVRLESSSGDSLGLHAVTVAGYSLPKGDPILYDTVFLKSFRIDKLYVHDDQVGPFATMKFINDSSQLETFWSNGSNGEVKANLSIAIVPTYHKIRIPFAVIYDLVVEFNNNPFISLLLEAIEISLEWDIYLNTINEVKNRVFSSSLQAKEEFLTRPMPKYIWTADAYFQEKLVISFLFDATDIEQGNLFLYALEYEDYFSRQLRVAIGLLQREDYNHSLEQIVSWFKENQR